MTTLVSNDCIECNLRLANDLEPICDGTGVISVSDIPESRVLVCPAWPCDEDEPLAYWEAVNGLGYSGPATMQQRIRDGVMAEVRSQSRIDELPVDEFAESTDIFRGILVAGGLMLLFFVIIAAGYIGWRYL